MKTPNRHCKKRTARRGNPAWIASLAFVITVSAITLPAHASDFESRSATPEYSGPSANIDSGSMGNTEPMVTRTPPLGPSSADAGFDRHIEDRGAKISKEMDHRRDDTLRLRKEHFLKTNE